MKQALHLGSIVGGGYVLFVGLSYIAPHSINYNPDKVWVALIGILLGIFVIAGNSYYILRGR